MDKENFKKKQERAHLDAFLRIYPHPQGEIIAGERPDFVIDARQKIGIELTVYHPDSGKNRNSSKSRGVLIERIVQESYEIFREIYNMDFEITFGFHKDMAISRERAKELPSEIADFVFRVRDCEGSVILGLNAAPKELNYAFNAGTWRYSRGWHVSGFYNDKNIPQERLSEILELKERSFRGYRQCDEMWLLIIVDGFDPILSANISSSMNISSNNYSRIIIYKTLGEYCEVWNRSGS